MTDRREEKRREEGAEKSRFRRTKFIIFVRATSSQKEGRRRAKVSAVLGLLIKREAEPRKLTVRPE